MGTRAAVEAVYAVFDYWDGPRSGVADFQGRPHAFACVFDEQADEWSDLYRIRPVSEDELVQVKREWESWKRDGSSMSITAAMAVTEKNATLIVRARFEGEMRPDGVMRVRWSTLA